MEHRTRTLFIGAGLLVVVAAVGATGLARRQGRHAAAQPTGPGAAVTTNADGNVVRESGDSTVIVNGKVISGASGDCVKAEGAAVTRPREIGAVGGVKVRGAIDLVVTPGAPALTVEAAPNLVDFVETRVENGVLDVSTHGCISGEIRVHLAAPALRSVALSGTGDITATAPLHAAGFSLSLSGSGSATLPVDVDKLETTVSGTGDVTLQGRATEHDVTISGTGTVAAADLATQITDVSLSGIGTLEADAAVELRGRISGTGSVRHKGAAASTISVSGIGKVSPL